MKYQYEIVLNLIVSIIITDLYSKRVINITLLCRSFEKWWPFFTHNTFLFFSRITKYGRWKLASTNEEALKGITQILSPTSYLITNKRCPVWEPLMISLGREASDNIWVYLQACLQLVYTSYFWSVSLKMCLVFS